MTTNELFKCEDVPYHRKPDIFCDPFLNYKEISSYCCALDKLNERSPVLKNCPKKILKKNKNSKLSKKLNT